MSGVMEQAHDQEIETILSTVDDTTFGEEDWNIAIVECQSLAAKWERLSGFLGLNYRLIEKIKKDHPNDADQCWSDALKKWIGQRHNTAKFGMPSWRTLIRAISNEDRLVFNSLAAKYQGGTSASIRATSLTSQHPKKEHQHLREILSSESQNMLFNFQELFTSTTDSLRDRNIPVDDITRHLQLLGPLKPTYTDLDVPPFRHQIRTLNSKTVDAVMSVVKDYCSFFSYRMLEHIINKLGADKDKENLAKYKEEFEKYAKYCVVDEGHSEMYVTLHDSFVDCHQNHVDLFISNLRKILKIPPSVKLNRIFIGSLKLIFQLPHSVQQDIFPLSPEQEALLANVGVIELSCRDYQFREKKNNRSVLEDSIKSDYRVTSASKEIDSGDTDQCKELKTGGISNGDYQITADGFKRFGHYGIIPIVTMCRLYSPWYHNYIGNAIYSYVVVGNTRYNVQFIQLIATLIFFIPISLLQKKYICLIISCMALLLEILYINEETWTVIIYCIILLLSYDFFFVLTRIQLLQLLVVSIFDGLIILVVVTIIITPAPLYQTIFTLDRRIII